VAKKKDKCNRPGCNCGVQEGGKYCSRYCESMFNQPASTCNCGHKECATGKVVRATA
jgi:hypothetical protein